MTKQLSELEQFQPCCYENFTSEDKTIIIKVSKALGNEARLEIYNFLMEMNSCFVGQIVDYLPLAQSTVSQHLKVLHDSGVIIGTIEGASTSYCINHKRMQRYYLLIGKLIQQQ